jgi:hypothetical protein
MSLHPATDGILPFVDVEAKYIITIFCWRECAFSSSHDQSKQGFHQGTVRLCQQDNLEVYAMGRR